MMPKSPVGHPFASTGAGVLGSPVLAEPRPRDCLTRSAKALVRAQSTIGSRPAPRGTLPDPDPPPAGPAPRPVPQAAARPRNSATKTLTTELCGDRILTSKPSRFLRWPRELKGPHRGRQGVESPLLCRVVRHRESCPPVYIPKPDNSRT